MTASAAIIEKRRAKSMPIASSVRTWPIFVALLCLSISPVSAKEKNIRVQLDGLCNVFTFHFHDNSFDKLLLGFKERDVCDGLAKPYGLAVVTRFHKQPALIASQIQTGGSLLELFIFSYPLSTGGTFTYYATENGKEIAGGVRGTYTVLSGVGPKDSN